MPGVDHGGDEVSILPIRLTWFARTGMSGVRMVREADATTFRISSRCFIDCWHVSVHICARSHDEPLLLAPAAIHPDRDVAGAARRVADTSRMDPDCSCLGVRCTLRTLARIIHGVHRWVAELVLSEGRIRAISAARRARRLRTGATSLPASGSIATMAYPLRYVEERSNRWRAGSSGGRCMP